MILLGPSIWCTGAMSTPGTMCYGWIWRLWVQIALPPRVFEGSNYEYREFQIDWLEGNIYTSGSDILNDNSSYFALISSTMYTCCPTLHNRPLR